MSDKKEPLENQNVFQSGQAGKNLIQVGRDYIKYMQFNVMSGNWVAFILNIVAILFILYALTSVVKWGYTTINNQIQNISENTKSKPKTPEEARRELGQLGIDYTDSSFYTYASRGDRLVVDLFLAAGMNASWGLAGAAAGGHTQLAKDLLERGANPNTSYQVFNESYTNCSSTLMRAVKTGNDELVTSLIEKGVDVNAFEGCALKEAIENGRISTAEILLKNGAKADSSTVDLAIENRQGNIVKLLINSGISVDLETLAKKAIDSGDAETIGFVIDSGFNPNARIGTQYINGEKATLLMEAVDKGSKKVVEVLLDKGADPNICVKMQRVGFSGSGDICPFSMALSRSSFDPIIQRDIAELLKKSGAVCEPKNAFAAENIVCAPSARPTLKQSQSSSSPQQTNPTSGISSFPRSSCGDTLPDDPNAYPVDLYPVFIEYTENNLEAVTAKFCKDAYQMTRKATGKKAIQVGSFLSRDSAEAFKNLMLKELGSGEVGETHRIESKK